MITKGTVYFFTGLSGAGKTTLSKLITKHRLKAAQNMLLSGKYSISSIVEEVNFSSESYFYSQFKKEFGMTPLKYKKIYASSPKNDT